MANATGYNSVVKDAVDLLDDASKRAIEAYFPIDKYFLLMFRINISHFGRYFNCPATKAPRHKEKRLNCKYLFDLYKLSVLVPLWQIF